MSRHAEGTKVTAPHSVVSRKWAVLTCLASAVFMSCDATPSRPPDVIDIAADVVVVEAADGGWLLSDAPDDAQDAATTRDIDELVWAPPPLPQPGPVVAGIPNCAPMFIDEEGVCRPRLGLCAGNELTLPHRGCTAFEKIPAEPIPEQVVIDVVEDSVAALGGGVGLAEALETAPAGALLRLGPGWFAGQYVITRDVHIEGASALVTHIDNLPAAGGVLFTVNAGHLAITDAFLDSGGDTVVVNGPGRVTLERIHLMGHGNLGILCNEGATCVARQTLFTPFSHAVGIVGTGEVALHEVTVSTEGKPGAVACGGDGGKLVVSDSLLSDAASPGPSIHPGCYGMDQVAVSGSILSGLFNVHANGLNVSDSLVLGTLGALTTFRVELRRSRVGSATTHHSFFAQDVVFEGVTQVNALGELQPEPHFLWFQGTTTLERVEVRGDVGDAVYVSRSLDAKQLRIVVARATEKVPGVGLRVYQGATARLEDSIIEQVQGHGVSTLGAKSVHLLRTTIRDLSPPPDQSLAYGVIASFGAHVTLENSRIERAHGIGLWARGATIDVDGLWIDDVAPGSGTDKNNGLIEGLSDGVLVADGATLNAKDLFIREAQRVAVLSDNGSGTIHLGDFDQCRYGLASTGSLDTWTLDQVDNRCVDPVWSKTTLAVPRPVTQ